MSAILPALSAALSPVTPPEESRRASAPKKERDWSQPNTESEQSFSFRDFLSVINPLQHIPVVGSLYRALTGDTINPASRVIGGLLFGGPIGLVASAFNAVVEQTTGKDLGEQALALFNPNKGTPAPTEPPAQFAEAVAAQTEPTMEEPVVAPPSRIVPGAASAPNAATSLGSDRTLAGSLYGPHPNAPTTLAAQGRSLADYRSFTGRPLPTIDTTRSASSNSAPIRLQPTAPMPERTRATAAPPAKEAKASEPTPAESASGANAPAAAPPPTNEGFVAAMSRGLDRYREQHRIGAPLQIDATL